MKALSVWKCIMKREKVYNIVAENEVTEQQRCENNSTNVLHLVAIFVLKVLKYKGDTR